MHADYGFRIIVVTVESASSGRKGESDMKALTQASVVIVMIAGFALFFSGCGKALTDEEAAWAAVVADIEARTPPGIQIKLTKTAYRVIEEGRLVEIDLIVAASEGFNHEVEEGCATVRKTGDDWELEYLY